MNKTDLIKQLQTLKAYKDERVRLGIAAVELDLLPELIKFCLLVN